MVKAVGVHRAERGEPTVALETGWGRRVLLPVTAALAVAVGVCLPANAAFSDRTNAVQTSVATTTVGAPGNVAAQLASCSNGRWMSVAISWTASSSSRVSGYLVKAYETGGQVAVVAQTDAASTGANITLDKLSPGTSSVSFTVTTRTSYGWSAESLPSGALTC
jgi:hypothetical protein